MRRSAKHRPPPAHLFCPQPRCAAPAAFPAAEADWAGALRLRGAAVGPWAACAPRAVLAYLARRSGSRGRSWAVAATLPKRNARGRRCLAGASAWVRALCHFESCLWGHHEVFHLRPVCGCPEPSKGGVVGKRPEGSEDSRSTVAPSTSFCTTLTVPSSFSGLPRLYQASFKPLLYVCPKVRTDQGLEWGASVKTAPSPLGE